MRRRLAVWLVGSALLAATAFLVGCAVTATFTPGVAFQHKPFPAGTACDATGCHTPDYFHPSYTHKQPYLGPCENCHNLVAWKQCTYSHKDTSFDAGMHVQVGCPKCHTEGKPLPNPACSSCHTAPHKGWQGCTNCHAPTAWGLLKPLPVGHVSLEGSHSALVCQDCHKAATEPAVARTCTNCHGTNHDGRTNCQDCHSPKTGWNPKPGWSHSTFFVLRGHHKVLDCIDCHTDGTFHSLPTVCVGCHGPHHGGLTNCAGCHTTTSFKPSTFNHSSVFPLVGIHRTLKCSRCHPGNKFAETISDGGTNCVDCHGPQHGGLTNCAGCHNTTSFSPATKFSHSAFFPLTGQHLTTSCTQCHPNSEFVHTISSDGGTDCNDCHPIGNPGVFHGNQTNCENCHTPIGFNITLPIVHPDPNVPLGAQHAWPNPCDRCHPGNIFNAPTRPCENCHGAGGSAAVTIPHVGPTHCTDCHQPTVWSDVSKFTHPVIPGNHHVWTSFGPYAAGCYSCHPGPGTNPDFTGYFCTATGCHV